MESISTAKAFAAKTRQRVQPDVELAAIGAANTAAGMVGGFCVAGGFSRGAVNFRAGARTQMSGVIAAITLVVAVSLATPAFTHLPKAVLAAVIVLAVANLVDLRAAVRIARMRHSDGLSWLVTFASTLLLGVAVGLGIGVGFAIALFLARTARPHLVEVGRVTGTTRYRNVDRWDVHVDPRVVLLRLDGPLYFADAAYLEDRVHALVRTRPQVEHVVLVASAISDVDATGAELLVELDRTLAETGVALHLTTVRGPVRDTLTAGGLWHSLVERGRVHLDVAAALRAALGPDPGPLSAPGPHEHAPPDLA